MGKFSTFRTTIETAKRGKEFYDANHDVIHGVGRIALTAAGDIRRDGLHSTARSIEERYNTPENQERLIRVTREMGSAGLKGAALETGVLDADGKVNKWGAFKALLGLKTGATYVRAAKGAARGVKAEARSQAYGLGNELAQSTAQYGANYHPANGGHPYTAQGIQVSGNLTPSPFGPPPPSPFNTMSPYSGDSYSQPQARRPQYQSNPFGPPSGYTAAPRPTTEVPPWMKGAA